MSLTDKSAHRSGDSKKRSLLDSFPVTMTVDEEALSQSKLFAASPLVREMMAELMGSFVMICFGNGVVAQVVLSNNKAGDYTHISICWGLAVYLAIHVSGGVSGAHLNPAVSTTMALFKKFEWSKVLPYSVAQLTGCFLGALMVNTIYYNAINDMDPDHTLATASIFATYPQAFVTTGSAFLTEMFATALLLGGIFAFSDERNNPSQNAPASVGLLVCGLGMAFGYPTGYALNPARDLGPRVMTGICGWGSVVFTSHNYYFWIPLVAPIVGGAVGGGVYTMLIKYHHPPAQPTVKGA